ncbi:hypothetical protein MRCV_sS2gp1 [Mal de Rio Cuarto virus]|uniref:P4 protein n=1 Tax=Mal de Rio Cuarto virus TaxID=185954 RepID=Q809F0_9REOV|nr:hypothetical protein MRCV_sS2gp1 [Mal de Rio Cuarto virus]AAO73183.1 unknown [Mal de Rio Cuarto virus]
MDQEQLLKYLLSQTIEERTQKIEQWQKEMESAGYTIEYLTQAAASLRIKSSIEKTKQKLVNESAKLWQGSLITKTVTPSYLFLGLSECSGVIKTQLDLKNIDFNSLKLNFSGFAKYWILTLDFEDTVVYNHDNKKVLIGKSKNVLNIQIDDVKFQLQIKNNFPSLVDDSPSYFPNNCNFDRLLRIYQSNKHVILELCNFIVNDETGKIVMQPESVKFIGDTSYFGTSSNLIFNCTDGYLGIDNLDLRNYFCHAVAMINLEKLKSNFESLEMKKLSNSKETVSNLHQLILNSMISISSLEKDVARVKMLKMNLSYTKSISLYIPSHKVFVNKYKHDLFEGELSTKYLGWNYIYGERDRTLIPIVCDIKSKLKLDSPHFNSSPTAFILSEDFGTPDNMFILNVIDNEGNVKKVICEAIFSLKYKSFNYIHTKAFDVGTYYQSDIYFFGHSEIELYDDDPQLRVLSLVSEKEGKLFHLIKGIATLVLSFKILSDNIEYLGNISPYYKAEFSYNGAPLKVEGKLSLSEDYDGTQVKKCLISDEYILNDDVKCLFSSHICDGMQSKSKSYYNGKQWPGVRSRIHDNDEYQNLIQAHRHNLSAHGPFRAYNNYSDILYSANNNYHYIEADGCFTERKNHLYWTVPTSTYPMKYDNFPCVKLTNKSILNVPITMTQNYDNILGETHPCLLNEPYYVISYSIDQKAPYPELKLPLSRTMCLQSMETSDGQDVETEIRVNSFDIGDFHAYVLPDNLNMTMNVVGKLLDFKSELDLILQTNTVMADMMNNLEKRLSNLEKFCDYLSNSYSNKLDSSASLFHFLGDVLTFVGEIAVFQFPILGFCFILTGIMLDAVGKILQDDIFDGISEVAIGALLLCLGKRKPKYTYLEEMGFGRRRASSNSYISEHSSSIGRRRSYSSYHVYESLNDISPSLSLKDRLLNQIRAHNPSVFDLHHNSGVMLELKQKQKDNYSTLNHSYSRMKRAISNVLNDETINYKLSCDNPSSCEIVELVVKTFDYYPLLLSDNTFFLFKVTFTVSIVAKPSSVSVKEHNIEYFHSSDTKSLEKFTSAKYSNIVGLQSSFSGYSYDDICNYLYVISLLSKLSSLDNGIIENFDKIYDTMYITSHRDYVGNDLLNSRQIDFSIFKATRANSFRNFEPDESYFKMLSTVSKHPEILRYIG